MKPAFCIGAMGSMWDAPARGAMHAAGVCQISLSPRDFMDGYAREDVLTLREHLHASGLKACTSHPPFGSFNEPFSALRQHPEELRAELDWMREFITRCGMLGIDAIPLHTGGAMLPDARPWEIDCLRRYIDALLGAAEPAGVTIAIENTNHATPVGFYEGIREEVPINRNFWKFDDTGRILEFVRSYASEHLKICYDTGHSHLLGRMMEDFHAFEDEIALLHIHDNEGAGNDAHVQPGYGNAPWKVFFAELGSSSGSPVCFVEARPRFGDLSRMLRELAALAESRVIVKRGGFLKKDVRGHIVVTSDGGEMK